MLKTGFVQPPDDADAIHTAVRRTLPRERAAAPGGRGGLTPVSSLDLFVQEAAGLRGLYTAGVLSYDEFDRSLIQLEIRAGAKPVLCEVCHARRASVTVGGKHLCSWGNNNPTNHYRLPTGDEVDRGWDSYKEATS